MWDCDICLGECQGSHVICEGVSERQASGLNVSGQRACGHVSVVLSFGTQSAIFFGLPFLGTGKWTGQEVGVLV